MNLKRSFLISSLLFSFSLQAAFAAPAITSVAVNSNGQGLCNSDSFTQVPGHLDYFIGRYMQNTNSNVCSGTTSGLALFKMDWGSNTLNLVRNILAPPFTTPKGEQINSAYDPTAILYNGEIWVAFECAGGVNLSPSSSCMAPFDFNGAMNAGRSSVVIVGVHPTNSPSESDSASVPKVLVFQNQVYLYWTSSHFQKTSPSDIYNMGATTRGTRLSQDAGGLRQFWAAGFSGRSQQAVDPASNVEVMGVDAADPTANALADVMGIYTDGQSVYALSGVGGAGCLTPVSPVFGCYRPRLSSSTNPLGTHIFNQNILQADNQPTNPHEYARIFQNPDGSLFKLGQYLNPTLNGSAPWSGLVPQGFFRTPFSLSQFRVSPNVSTDGVRPNPLAAASTMGVTFSSLRIFMPACTSGNAVSDTCNAAIERFCVSQGFAAGGYGPEEYVGDNVNITCLRGERASQVAVTFSTLKGFNPACGSDRALSDSCHSAIHNFCNSRGFEAGGFGPSEHGGDNAVVTCVHSSPGAIVGGTFTELNATGAACTAATPVSAACSAAVSRACQAHGFMSGYGILEHSGDNVVFGCLKSSN